MQSKIKIHQNYEREREREKPSVRENYAKNGKE